MPERPADIGTVPYGALPAMRRRPASQRAPIRCAPRFATLAVAARVRDFWLLFATFFICGFTTNGLIGTHLISMCADYGIAAVDAAGLLAMMGVFDLVGTTASGWLTDRYDARMLLFIYYGLRGLSLIYLPYSDFTLLRPVAVCRVLRSRLDRHCAADAAADQCGVRRPGRARSCSAGSRPGTSWARPRQPSSAGALRSSQGTYLEAFFIAGAAALLAAGLSLLIARPVPEERGRARIPGRSRTSHAAFPAPVLERPRTPKNGPRLAKAGAGVRRSGSENTRDSLERAPRACVSCSAAKAARPEPRPWPEPYATSSQRSKAS